MSSLTLHLLSAAPVLMLASCVMMGISVFMTTLAVGRTLRQGAAPLSAAIGEAQRQMRREQAKVDGSGPNASVMRILPFFTTMGRMIPLGTVKTDLAERYAAAGWPGGIDDDEVLGISLMIGIGLGVVLGFASLMLMQLLKMTGIIPLVVPILLFLVGLLLGPGLVSGRLEGMAKERGKSISRMMPFVLDLLVLTIRAGAALRMALERVTIDFNGTPIGTEFKATLSDLEMGMNNKEAFQNLARRAPEPVVRTFVDDLLQSEELGRPIADTLESLADRVRIMRVQNAIDTAGRAKVMVLIPGTLILLACMIMLFSPFIVKFYYQGSAV